MDGPIHFADLDAQPLKTYEWLEQSPLCTASVDVKKGEYIAITGPSGRQIYLDELPVANARQLVSPSRKRFLPFASTRLGGGPDNQSSSASRFARPEGPVMAIYSPFFTSNETPCKACFFRALSYVFQRLRSRSARYRASIAFNRVNFGLIANSALARCECSSLISFPIGVELPAAGCVACVIHLQVFKTPVVASRSLFRSRDHCDFVSASP